MSSIESNSDYNSESNLTFNSYILDFWFSLNNSKKWFVNDHIFDKEIYDKFNSLLETTRHISLDYNLDNNDNIDNNQIRFILENIILFDQMSRNIFRVNNHNHRSDDDIIALDLANYLISNNKLNNLKQEYFYFVILPLRHTKNSVYCRQAIDLIKNYEDNNLIINEQEWLNFKCASYRSLYDSTSYGIINDEQIFESLSEYYNSVDYFRDIIDPVILNINNFKIHYIINNNIIIDTIYKSMTKHNKSLDDSYCISLSGGVDSMVIAYALAHLGKLYGFSVHAVHIQHSNREEASREAEMIKEYCMQLNIIFHHIKIEHIKRHEINRDFYETETRRIRFDFYRNIKKHYQVNLFSLGHHRGDVAENVFVNLLKGRTLLDLPVMSEFDEQEGVCLWRPLLNLPKSEILKFAEEYGIIYTKNSTPEWSVRGKLRNIILPQLNDMFNQVELNLYNAGKESSDLCEYVNTNIVDNIVENTVYGKLGFYFPINKLRNANFTIWKLSLQKIFHNNHMNMLKDHVIRELMLLQNKIINPCKNYISYCDNNNLIFLNNKYFDLIDDKKKYKIDIKNVDNSYRDINITLDNIINGIVQYTIYSNQDLICSSVLSKYMKQRFNKILPGDILHKYVWIVNNYKSGSHKHLITITYN